MRYDSDPYIFTAVAALGEAARIFLWHYQDAWAHKFSGGVLTPATLGDQYVPQLRAAGVSLKLETPCRDMAYISLYISDQVFSPRRT